LEFFDQLWAGSGLAQITGGQFTMIVVSLVLLYLAIAKKFEPLLLVTIGFGGLLSNIPGVEIATGDGLLHLIYVIGIETGAFPLLIFMGVGSDDGFWTGVGEPQDLLAWGRCTVRYFCHLARRLGAEQPWLDGI
jgi:oxaloacetate decarboxylase beta subunit